MWTYQDKPFTSEMIEDYIGFVYLIKNLDTNKFYIGKKLFTRSKTYQKNNKKKKTRVESDWINYTGSNKILMEEVANGANLDKKILHLCTSKGWLTYTETKEIINREALLSDKFYNNFVGCKIHARHLTPFLLK